MKFYTKKERTYIGNAPITHIHNISDLVRKYKRITVVLLGILAVSILINIYLVFAKTEPQSAQEAAGVIMVTLPAVTTEPGTEVTEIVQPRYYDVPLSHELQDYIRNSKYGIDLALVLAVIEIESDYQTDVISETNDWGLMQINAVNHQWLAEQYGLTDMLDTRQNLDAGMLMLSMAIDQASSMHGALMVYNCGLSRAKELWELGIYETGYSRKVLDKYEEIRRTK